MQIPGIELEGPYKSTTAVGGDSYWYSGGGAYWDSLQIALQEIPVSKRAGLTIALKIDNIVKEYWWPDETKLTETDLVLKLSEATPVDLTPYATKTELTDSIATITKEYLGLDKVDNTPDSAKPISTAVENALIGKADKDQLVSDLKAINDKLTDIQNAVTEEFQEFKTFTYSGVTPRIKLSFTPRSAGLIFLSGNIKLNPFYDYKFEGDILVLREDELTINNNYKLDITYNK